MLGAPQSCHSSSKLDPGSEVALRDKGPRSPQELVSKQVSTPSLMQEVQAGESGLNKLLGIPGKGLGRAEVGRGLSGDVPWAALTHTG